MLKLRRAKKEDFEQFYSLNRTFENEYKKISINEQFKPFTREQTNKEFKNKLNNYFIVADINKKLVGYFEGIFYKKYKKGYISDLFVLRKFRKQGIATKMKNLFIKELKKRKYKEIALDVNKRNHAIKTYENWGFKTVKYGMLKKLK